MLAQFYIDSLWTSMATYRYPIYPEALCWRGDNLCFKGVITVYGEPQAKKLAYSPAIEKTSAVILVFCLFSLSIASAAAIHYGIKPHSLQSSSHQTGTNVNTSSQQKTGLVSSGASKLSQSTASSSSADISVDFGNRQINTYPIPSTILGVGGVGLKPAGVFVNGFYTRTLDSMALVNTTASDYQALNISG